MQTSNYYKAHFYVINFHKIYKIYYKGGIAIKKSIIDRIYLEAEYIIQTKSTIRETAKKFSVSKSTVHKDLSERLKELDINLYKKVSKIMKNHIDIRHIRGGESTRRKYKNI